MKRKCIALCAAALVSIITLSTSSLAQALDDGEDPLRIYESPADEDNLRFRPDFTGWVTLPTGGMTPREAAGFGRAVTKGGDGSTGADKTGSHEYVNLHAGEYPDRVPMELTVLNPGSLDTMATKTITTIKDLSSVAEIIPQVHETPDGTRVQLGETIVFSPNVVTSQADLGQRLIKLTGGEFSSCDATGNSFSCVLFGWRKLPSRPAIPAPAGTWFTSPLAANRIPSCSGALKDGGQGVQTVVGIDDVICDARPADPVVRLEVDTIHADTSAGIPTTRGGDGSIVYSGTAAAEGSYLWMKVYAISAAGVYSWPFIVGIRNHYVPSAAGTPSMDVLRGVDTALTGTSLFHDVDIDSYGVESGDYLSMEVVEQGEKGSARFDADGTLHYQSIDVIHGEADDHVTVRATDRFGIRSPDVTVIVHIGDTRPGCANGTATTDTRTPVRIVLNCWITPTDGWRQITGIDYTITSLPEFGTVSEFDPVAGTAIFTPDPAHPGPDRIQFTATNNGAVRTAALSLEVLPVP